MRRALGLKKKSKRNWVCPKCGTLYPLIYVQAHDMPYLMCHKGCSDFFDLEDNNVTAKLYPNGKPWPEGGAE